MADRDRLIELRLKKPFVPFQSTLKDGRSFDIAVAHSFAVGMTVVLIPKKTSGVERVAITDIKTIDLLQTSR